MSQSDFNIANQGFPATRAEINVAFQAAASNSSGATEPSATYAYQYWYDTTLDELKIRDETNSSWIVVGSFDQTGLTFTPDLTNLDTRYATTLQGTKADQLAGRNLIINGSGRVNQRAYVSGTATTTSNEFTLDRWYVITNGQSLTYTGGAAGRVMTAPALGAASAVEGANVVGGTYVLSYTGTATCKVNGLPRASGDSFALPADTAVKVVFFGGTFTDVQLEFGTVPTVFEQLTFSTLQTQCERYYETGVNTVACEAPAGSAILSAVNFGATKAGSPTITQVNPRVQVNVSSTTVDNVQVSGFNLSVAGVASSFTRYSAYYIADAEIVL